MSHRKHLLLAGAALIIPVLLTGCEANKPAPLPTYPAPTTNIEQRARAAGLSLLPEGKLAEHIHAHLTVVVDGRIVNVPAHIGINTKVKPSTYSEIHTHDTSGIIHIESPYKGRFYLRQLFAEWGVPLQAHGIGTYVNGRDGVRFAVFINKKPYLGDLRQLEFRNLQDITLAITTNGSEPILAPSFQWPDNYIPKSSH